MYAENTKNDLERMSPGPWEYLRDQGGHWIVSGLTKKPLGVFTEENNARAVVEILLALPDLLDDYDESYRAEDYDAVAEENDRLEKEVERLDKLLEGRDKEEDRLKNEIEDLKDEIEELEERERDK